MVQLLIVDDEPLVQIGIRSMLNWESMGIEIAGTATNGRQAYDIILEKHPEIVITDIKMPIMDGMQLIEKCQSQEHPPLFILLTSYEEFALVKQAISYQVLDYLVKLELTEDVLNAAIQKALGILEKERKQAAIPETGSDLSLLQDNFYIRLLLNLFETEEQFRHSAIFCPSASLPPATRWRIWKCRIPGRVRPLSHRRTSHSTAAATR